MIIDGRDKALLKKMAEYCQRIEAARNRFGNSFESFSSDADYKDVVCMNIFQIGELSNQISDSLKETLSSIPWSQMYGIRNILAHAYIKLDDKIVWDTVVNDIPKLGNKLQEIL